MRLRILVILAFAVVAPLAARAQTITTVAGGGPINLPKASASIGTPAAVRHDSLGNTYILDNDYSRVYKIDHTTGNMSVFAGNGASGFSGEGGPAVNAEMNGPSGMCLDANDNLFIVDSDNDIVREVPAVTAGGKTAGNIYTVAGVAGDTDYGGDGGIATNGLMEVPDGCAFDSVGNLYIADRFNHVIRMVAGPTPPAGKTTGFIYTFAGTGQTAGYGGDGAPATAAGALLSNPFDVFVDSHDNVFIAEVGNNVIREVAATTAGGHVIGDLYTAVGAQQTAGGYNGQNIVATSALLNSPKGLFVDTSGDIFFADSVNQVIREVPAASSVAPPMTAGFIYNVVGTAGTSGYSGDGGTAITASLDFPAGMIVDSTGSIFIADADSNAIRQVTSNTANYTTETIDTFAGNGSFSYGGDGALATDGQLNAPSGVASDAVGNLAIADQGNDLIRGIAAPISTGNLSTIVGETEFNGFLGDNAPTSPSVENGALSTVFDASGNEFIADTDNCIVREITGGNILTVAGTDPVPVPDTELTTPQCGFSGATGPAKSAKLGLINGVAVDGAGNIFFSDATNNVIWEVAKTTTASMTAGNIYIAVGTAAQLKNPTGVFIDVFGNLFIADTGNSLIREVPADNTTNPPMTAGTVYTVAGNLGLGAGFSGDTGPATGAQLNSPFAIAVDHADNIFIADTNNQVIREVTAADGNINTVAGTPGTAGFFGDGGAASAAQLSSPQGLAIDGAGDLLLADSANNRVRSIANFTSVAAVPVASFNPNSVTFLPQPLNIASNSTVVTLTNNGGAALTGITISIGGADPGDFSQTHTCPGSLSAGLNCTITVTFKPTVVGARSAWVSIADNSLGHPQTVTLSGNGIAGAPADVLSPKPLVFTPGQLVGVGTTQNITLSNATGTAPLSIALVNGIAISGTNAGDFSQTNNCGTTVAIGTGCTIMVTFKPTSATPAARTATLTLTDNALDSGQTVTLTGTAVAPADVLSPNPLTFATTQSVGVPATQNITLSNATGTAPLSIALVNGIAISGTNAGDFSQTNNCGTTVALGASCTIMVTFDPTSATPPARTATLTLTDNAADSGQTVILSGTAVAPAPSATLSAPAPFADQFVGTSSAAQKVTLTNTGTAALAITSIAPGGANPGDYAQTNTCGMSLAAGANCTISVTFTPTTTGARPANITVTDNASPTTQTASLTGNGFNISLAAASGGSISQTVTAGQIATYNLQFTTTGGAPTDTVNVAIACSGAPALSTLTCPATQAAPGTFAITASTTAAGLLVPQSQPEPPAVLRTLPLTLLAVLLSIAAMLAWMQSPAGRLRTVRVALVACLVLMPMSATMFLTGCASSGGSGGTTPPPSGGTPSGTYTLTVTQTVTGAKPQTTKLTLIVQ